MRFLLVLFLFGCMSLDAQPSGVWRLTGTRYSVDPFTRCATDEKSGEAGDVTVMLWGKCDPPPYPSFKVRAQWQAPPTVLTPGQVFPWEQSLTPLACTGKYGGMVHLSATVLDYDYMGPTDVGCGQPMGAAVTYSNGKQSRPMKVPAPTRQWAKTFTLRVKLASNSDFMWDYTYTFEPAGLATTLAVKPPVIALGGLPDVWTVTEAQLWSGTWTRRPGTNTFDASWRHASGALAQDVLDLESVQGDQLTIYRRGIKGRYTATLSPDHRRLLNGTATWYEKGWTWSASAVR